MLTARTERLDYVEAAEGLRGQAYFCRGCANAVVLKAGRVRIAHFAHKPDAACAFGSRMSLAHLMAQRRIAQALRGRGVHAELEAFMPSLAGDLRIDVLAWPAERPGLRIAIEVQASDMTSELIDARTRSYNAEGVAPLWLRLLDFGAFETVQRLPFRGTIWIDKYRPRAWERWAHDHLGGRLWFLDQATFLAWRGAFAPAHSYCGASTWREITQWVQLELEGPFDLAALRLNRGRASQGGAAPERLTERLGAWFLAPGEDAPPPVAPFVRSRLEEDGAGVRRELQVRIGDRWVHALVEGAHGCWRTRRGEVRPIL